MKMTKILFNNKRQGIDKWGDFDNLVTVNVPQKVANRLTSIKEQSTMLLYEDKKGKPHGYILHKDNEDPVDIGANIPKGVISGQNIKTVESLWMKSVIRDKLGV